MLLSVPGRHNPCHNSLRSTTFLSNREVLPAIQLTHVCRSICVGNCCLGNCKSRQHCGQKHHRVVVTFSILTLLTRLPVGFTVRFKETPILFHHKDDSWRNKFRVFSNAADQFVEQDEDSVHSINSIFRLFRKPLLWKVDSSENSTFAKKVFAKVLCFQVLDAIACDNDLENFPSGFCLRRFYLNPKCCRISVAASQHKDIKT